MAITKTVYPRPFAISGSEWNSLAKYCSIGILIVCRQPGIYKFKSLCSDAARLIGHAFCVSRNLAKVCRKLVVIITRKHYHSKQDKFRSTCCVGLMPFILALGWQSNCFLMCGPNFLPKLLMLFL